MTLSTPSKKNSRTQLYFFIYGSLGFLLICLGTAAFVFSETYLKKEQERAADSAELISHFFDSQYRGMTEEMWTRNYEAVHFRLAEIAKQLGHASYEMVLADENGNCVYAANSLSEKPNLPCKIPDSLKAEIPKFRPDPPQPVLQFDYKSNRYIYMVPYYVGAVLKGYLHTAISDPYEFQHESSLGLVFKIFTLPIACILLAWLLWLFISHRLILKPYLSRLVEMEKKQAVGELAGQVAHNIRSPLVVLNSVVRSIKTADPIQRRLLISASSRIEKIANGLMSQLSSQTVLEGSTSDPFCFLWPVIESIVAEKIVVQTGNPQIEISYHLSDDLYGAGVPISSEELSTVFSNLANNAIEAFENLSQTHCKIEIAAEKLPGNRIRTTIEDNGKGMPAEILNKLRTVGGTYGKSGGSGIGLPHARDVLERIGGNVSIESVSGKGTKLVLELPQAPAPSWCPTQLDLSAAKNVVVLDDDPSLHLLWQQRLGKVPCTYLTDPDQFNISEFPPEDTFYILDYEFEGSSTTGLNLILNHQLGSRAVLVTSYFHEPEIQSQVIEAGAQMLPKFMINRIHVELGSVERSKTSGRYDLVLIDDDLMIHELWKFDASQHGKMIRTISKPSDLNWDEISVNVPIYIDKNLSDGVSGIDVAQDLHTRGFRNITLTTGENPDLVQVPSFIREVRNKDFPAA